MRVTADQALEQLARVRAARIARAVKSAGQEYPLHHYRRAGRGDGGWAARRASEAKALRGV
ncbi:MAG TPA: hypothetical protein VGU20_31235 [Stellaceae bacterium]|nr:hypothetical protein [Terriglobia bacterium]HEV2551826.1 hypothetical protein [Stellaceae bacterium]